MTVKQIDSGDTNTKIKFSDLGLSEKMLSKIQAK
jgi:hypothetical protein